MAQSKHCRTTLSEQSDNTKTANKQSMHKSTKQQYKYSTHFKAKKYSKSKNCGPKSKANTHNNNSNKHKSQVYTACTKTPQKSQT